MVDFDPKMRNSAPICIGKGRRVINFDKPSLAAALRALLPAALRSSGSDGHGGGDVFDLLLCCPLIRLRLLPRPEVRHSRFAQGDKRVTFKKQRVGANSCQFQ
jgi:hypothetical protein